MTDLLEVNPPPIRAADLQELDQFTKTLPAGELRDLLTSLAELIQDGDAATFIRNNKDYTPSYVAQQLGMSRTHLYKLLDSGEIPSHRVGRDRRIAGRDIAAFEAQRQRERRALAERFANAESIRSAAIDELADEL